MKVSNLLSLALAAASASTATAQRLLPDPGKIFLGAWYQRLEGDLAKDVNARISGIPGAGLSFFQTDIDISVGKDPRTALNITEPYLAQLEDTGTNAFAYLTIYPHLGYDRVTDAELRELGERLLFIIQRGRKVFLRLYPEMNGTWFFYGQDPEKFKAAWRRAVDIILGVIGPEFRDEIALIWAPNSGNGYPWRSGIASPRDNNDPRIPFLDTDGNGILDNRDNPYTPFYPGDDYVDWVGISVYHYGFQWPWIQNIVPTPNKFEGIMEGFPNTEEDWSRFPLYTPFSGPNGVPGLTAGNKPFMLAEGGATYHADFNEDGRAAYPGQTPNRNVSRIEIKQAFWRQFLNRDFLAKYPNFRSVCTFEFIKSEELTYRDFTNFGAPPMNLTGNEDANTVAPAFVADVRDLDFIQWASSAAVPTTTRARASTAGPATITGSATASQSVAVSSASTTPRANAAVGHAGSMSWTGAAMISAMAVVLGAGFFV
ncbi:hypothetical protein HDU67_006699 [Dinochytrium kinnereticum]|nr:hypothetical protein HDU67_006699 [Dinochytrium kinnereticum]